MVPLSLPEISLTSWRRLKPQDYGFDGDVILLGLLLDRTAFSDEPGRRLVTAAAGGEVAAMVAIADRLGHKASDLTYSWLALAALHNDLAARSQLAAELMRMAFNARLGGRRRESVRLAALAAEWFFPLARQVATAFGPDRADLAQTFAKAADAVPVPQEESAPEPKAVRSGDTLVVLPRGIPVLRGDREDRALIEAWKPLTEPLPLVPGLDAGLLATVLELEFPWMAEAIGAVADDLRLRQALGQPAFHLRPLLLLGPPGTGKTSFAHRIAELCGVASEEVRAGGSTDNRLIAGTARGWGTAQPGLVLQVIRRAGIANPLMVVDEVDKAQGGSRNGDIRNSLLALTERQTARAWTDECLCSPADLSRVSWLLTANDAMTLRGPLLTRLRVAHVPPPGPGHFDAVLAGIRRAIARDFGLAVDQVPPPPEPVIARLRKAARAGISLRRLRAAYERHLVEELALRPSAGLWMTH